MVTFCMASPVSKSTCLYNVPPPSLDDPEAVKAAADRESPPQSFYELQINSARAAQLAINDGFKLLEVEVRQMIKCPHLKPVYMMSHIKLSSYIQSLF